MEKFGQSLALSKNLLIAAWRLSGDGLALSVIAARCHLSQRERLLHPAKPALCLRLSLWESWRGAPERARMLTEKSRRSDSIALPKNLLIAAWRLSGDGLALSVIAARCHLSQRERLLHPAKRARTPTESFLRLLLKKLLEDTFYWTFILLYFGQNKKTQEGRGMKDVELRYVGGHVEVYTGAGAFLFSADTLREAMEELDAA